jgi:hypothetical protein
VVSRNGAAGPGRTAAAASLRLIIRSGYIQQLPSGAFRVSVYAGTDPLTGRQIRLRRTCKTERAAQIELGKLLEPAADGRRPDSRVRAQSGPPRTCRSRQGTPAKRAIARQVAQRVKAQQAQRQASSEYAARIERQARAQPEAGRGAETRHQAEIEM